MPDFGLLNTGAQTPMRAAATFEDPIARETRQTNLQTSQFNLGEKQREADEAAQDRSLIQAYAKQGGNFATSEGIQKALKDLGPNLSMAGMEKLQTFGTNRLNAETAWANNLIAKGNAAVKQYTDGMERTMPFING